MKETLKHMYTPSINNPNPPLPSHRWNFPPPTSPPHPVHTPPTINNSGVTASFKHRWPGETPVHGTWMAEHRRIVRFGRLFLAWRPDHWWPFLILEIVAVEC